MQAGSIYGGTAGSGVFSTLAVLSWVASDGACYSDLWGPRLGQRPQGCRAYCIRALRQVEILLSVAKGRSIEK